jgi:hypothetical protein
MYCRKNPETPITIGTFQNVNFENPRYQGSPGVIPRTPLFLVSVLFMPASIGYDFGTLWNNGSPPLCRRTEQPMKSYGIDSRSRNQNSQPREEFQRFKDNMRGSISPRCFQSVSQSTIRQLLQAVHCDWRPRRIAQQTFQTFAVGGANSHSSMHAETGHHGASGTLSFETFVPKFSEGLHLLSGIGPCRQPVAAGASPPFPT